MLLFQIKEIKTHWIEKKMDLDTYSLFIMEMKIEKVKLKFMKDKYEMLW